MEKIIVLNKYLYYGNVFLKKSAKILPEYTQISKHAIKIEKDKKLYFISIFSLS